MTRKRLTAWGIIFVCSLIIFGIIKYNEKNNLPEEKKEPFTICTNINYVGSGTQNFFKNTSHLKKKYRVEQTNDINKADTIITSNFEHISKEYPYHTIAYTPLIALLSDNTKSKFEKYQEKGLIQSTSQKIKYDNRDELTINISKLIDAVIENKNWSEFGGDDVPISIYCPLENTIDGELFNKFILIAANNGVYPNSEEEINEAKIKLDLFFASKYVQRIDINDKLSKLGNFENEIYFAFENDFAKSAAFLSDSLISICYPNKTVIREIYYQAKTPIAVKVQETKESFFIHEGFTPEQCYDYIFNSRRYRSEFDLNPFDNYTNIPKNIQITFSYTEIPKPF